VTSIRREGPTLNGGAYELAVYVRLATFEEVDEADADGLVITEYGTDGGFLFEMVGTLRPDAPPGRQSQSTSST